MKLVSVRMCVVLFFITSCYSGYAKNHSVKNSRKNGSQKPNIIFILTDDQRWSALGYSGNKNIETPEMDKLAQSGVYFKNAIATTPICSASRSTIFSGVHERTHRYTFQTGPIRSELMDKSYPKLLKDAGYYTGFFGKFGVKYNEKEKLFDVIEDYDRSNKFRDYRAYCYKTLNGDSVHLTRYTGQKALDFINDAPSDKPFCLSLSFSAPHAHDRAPDQYFWQKESDHLYQDMEMPAAKLSDDKYFNQLPKIVKDGFNRLRWTWRYDTPKKYQHSVKGYYRMIKGVDLEIAKIRAKLKEKGLDKNTIIMLMGDNGQFLGERQLAGKWLMYDNSIRIPFIVFDPRARNHQDISDMALNLDVPATILDFAGLDQPESWQGKSLVPIVTGKQSSIGRDTILIEHLWESAHIPPSEGVRTSTWKYLRYISDKSIEELYNLEDDPQEVNNLADNEKYKKTLIEFQNKCDELTLRYADPFSGIPTNLAVKSINKSKPSFSWELPKKVVKQKVYQILVSSSEALASKNVGDVWNSDKQKSNQSAGIEFGGNKLAPNTKYFWRVRIYDQDNRTSEYSEINEFITGSLE